MLFLSWALNSVQTPPNLITGIPHSCLEKKHKSNSWQPHVLCDAVLEDSNSQQRNCCEFECVIRNSMREEIWWIYNIKYSQYNSYSLLVCPLWFLAFCAVLSLLCHHCYSCYEMKPRLHTMILTIVHTEAVCTLKILQIGNFSIQSLKSLITASWKMTQF